MEIGKIIRSKREELKMTQQQLADQLYVTRQTISKWELGKSEPDALSKKGLEKILAVQLVQESSSKENRGGICCEESSVVCWSGSIWDRFFTLTLFMGDDAPILEAALDSFCCHASAFILYTMVFAFA